MAQAGLLAQRDSLSPFRVVLATSAVSLAGDLLFIGRLGWGVAGAAWTTLLAQYLGAALLLGALARSAVRPRLRVPSGAELRALLDTFGILTVFYAAKNFSYLCLQARALCAGGWGLQGASLPSTRTHARLHAPSMQPQHPRCCRAAVQSTAAQLSALVLAAHQPVWSLWCLVR